VNTRRLSEGAKQLVQNSDSFHCGMMQLQILFKGQRTHFKQIYSEAALWDKSAIVVEAADACIYVTDIIN
jgi:hypothetical protein